jgi:hypothetical protein
VQYLLLPVLIASAPFTSPACAGKKADKATMPLRHATDVFAALFALPKLEVSALQSMLGIELKRAANDKETWQYYLEKPPPAPLAGVRMLESKTTGAKFFSLDFAPPECVPLALIDRHFGPRASTTTSPESFGPLMAGVTIDTYVTPIGNLEVGRRETCVTGFVVRTQK